MNKNEIKEAAAKIKKDAELMKNGINSYFDGNLNGWTKDECRTVMSDLLQAGTDVATAESVLFEKMDKMMH